MDEKALALRYAQELDRRGLLEEADELRRLHAEVERLTKISYDQLSELTALRAAEQMRKRIDALAQPATITSPRGSLGEPIV